jgi:hypothetical protein
MRDEPQVPVNLVRVAGVGQVGRRIAVRRPIRGREATDVARAEQAGDVVRCHPVPVGLDREVETAFASRPEKPRPVRRLRWPLGNTCMAGKRQQLVDVLVHPIEQRFHFLPGDHGDPQIGSGPAQRPPRGQGADQIAQSDAEPDDGDRADSGVSQQVHSRGVPTVSVIMPTHRQTAFLPIAVTSLFSQSTSEWELIVVDDGCPDDVPAALGPFLGDPRVSYHRLPENRGLGAAINAGLDLARGRFIAYLPSDDLYDARHLDALLACMSDDVTLACSGVRHHHGVVSSGAPDGHGMQLVQIMHRAGPQRWTTREELESDDLERLFLAKIRGRGRQAATGVITCTWTDHPDQRHKAISERYDGGVNVFRRRYRVTQPLRLHSRDAGTIDEITLYRHFRDRTFPSTQDGPTVLLVGELAYNPERVLALAERGIRLYGLWTPDGLGHNTVGPLPFGHVTDLPQDHWRSAVRALAPDVIYAQLDWRAVPFAAEVLDATPEIPFVWHFKESPQRSIVRGEWDQLARLCREADAVLLSTPEERDWFNRALPGQLDPDTTGVLDASLPKADWLNAEPSPPLSAADGHVHTAVLGRPVGLAPDFVATLAAHDVHLHCHGLRDVPGRDGRWQQWLERVRSLAPGRVHLHPPVDQRQWVEVLSRYDAGWMHRFHSDNEGEVLRSSWDDLNYPARLGTYVAAGLPLLQQRNAGSVVAVERLVERERIGMLYTDAEDLAHRIRHRDALSEVREQVWSHRCRFTFDHHTNELIALFRRVVGRPTRRAERRATAIG